MSEKKDTRDDELDMLSRVGQGQAGGKAADPTPTPGDFEEELDAWRAMGHYTGLSIDRAYGGWRPWIVKIAFDPPLPRQALSIDGATEHGVDSLPAAVEFTRKWLRDTMAREIDRRQKMHREGADAFAALPPAPAR
jgi:hypothetical protein